MGVPTLREIFEEKYYADLAGGILESFGRLFKNDLKIYAYPMLDAETGSLITAGNLRVAPNLRHLYDYLLENRLIESLRDFDQQCLPIYSRDVLARIRCGDDQLGGDDAAGRGGAHQTARTPGVSDAQAGSRSRLKKPRGSVSLPLTVPDRRPCYFFPPMLFS